MYTGSLVYLNLFWFNLPFHFRVSLIYLLYLFLTTLNRMNDICFVFHSYQFCIIYLIQMVSQEKLFVFAVVTLSSWNIYQCAMIVLLEAIIERSGPIFNFIVKLVIMCPVALQIISTLQVRHT